MKIPTINGIPLDASRQVCVDMRTFNSGSKHVEKARDFDFRMLDESPKFPMRMITPPKRKSFNAMLPAFLEPIGSSVATGRLGYMQFEMTGARAVISLYYPQETATGNCAGLGYYFEFIACNVLKSEGIIEVSTSAHPHFRRARQLGRVGLPLGKPIDIRGWIEAMVRGLHLSKEYLAGFAARQGAQEKQSRKYAPAPEVLLHPGIGGAFAEPAWGATSNGRAAFSIAGEA